VPSVTYIGRSYETPNVDATHPAFLRGVTREVTQAWMDKYGLRFGDDYIIEGWTQSDDDGDGIPDGGWARKDILKWLQTYEIAPRGYATKSTLLELVETVMSPDGVEETEDLIADTAEEAEETQESE